MDCGASHKVPFDPSNTHLLLLYATCIQQFVLHLHAPKQSVVTVVVPSHTILYPVSQSFSLTFPATLALPLPLPLPPSLHHCTTSAQLPGFLQVRQRMQLKQRCLKAHLKASPSPSSLPPTLALSLSLPQSRCFSAENMLRATETFCSRML